jgi:hypothetical protein
MKKLLLVTGATILVALNTFGQGQGVVTFTSVGASGAKLIRDCNGVPLSGSAYAVALYWGSATATDPRNLQQIGNYATFLTGTSAGTYFGGGRTITTPGSAVNGPVLTFQIRVWMTAYGSSYEQAASVGGILGQGPMFTLKTKDLTNPLETTPNLYQAPGYTGFQPIGVGCPEPSTIALGLLGAGALFLLRRKPH